MNIKFAPKVSQPAPKIVKPAPQPKPAIAEIRKAVEAVEKRPAGRPSKGRKLVSIRLDPDVIEALKSKGNWQDEANTILRKELKI